MVATTGPGIEPVGTEELEQATAGQRVPCPFDLQIWDVDRMLNFEIADDPAYEGLELQVFDIGPCGIDVDIRLTDLAGREIRVRIDERDRRRRHQGTLLAPVGSTIEHPVSLPLFLMGGCDLVRHTGPVFDLRIGGRRVTTGRLPGGWLHRRRLVKYTAAPTAVVLNPAGDGPVATVDPRTPGNVRFEGPSNGIGSLQARTAGHCAALVLETGLPPLMAAVTRIAPVFRTWPTTYRWSATITLGDQPMLRSRWQRKSNRRDQSYRRLTSARPR